MNISGFIKNLKEKQREKETLKAKKVAESLKSLKQERIRLEGQKKIYDLQAEEMAKLKKAKEEVKKKRLESTFAGRIALNVQEKIKDAKIKVKTEKKPLPTFMKEGKGLFEEQTKSPWALQKEEQKRKPAVMKGLKKQKKIKKVVYYK